MWYYPNAGKHFTRSHPQHSPWKKKPSTTSPPTLSVPNSESFLDFLLLIIPRGNWQVRPNCMCITSTSTERNEPREIRRPWSRNSECQKWKWNSNVYRHNQEVHGSKSNHAVTLLHITQKSGRSREPTSNPSKATCYMEPGLGWAAVAQSAGCLLNV